MAEAEQEILRRLSALEAEVIALRDREEIRELIARYCYHADTGRDDAWVELWSGDDARFEIGRAVEASMPSSPLAAVYEGTAGLQEFIADPGGHHNDDYGRRVHVMDLNLVIHLDNDTAIVNGNWLTLRMRGGGYVVGACGNNQWTVRKVAGRWALQECRRRHLGNPGYTSNMEATVSRSTGR